MCATVICRSFAHDTAWGDAIHEVKGCSMAGWNAFSIRKPAALMLTLRHGLRIIGAAILMPDCGAENHLAPGPCVLMEYRNRGLGTALLGESLRQLREAGLTRASARTQR